MKINTSNKATHLLLLLQLRMLQLERRLVGINGFQNLRANTVYWKQICSAIQQQLDLNLIILTLILSRCGDR